MSNDPLTADVSSRICNHMNEDHREAVVAYAKYYGHMTNVKNAKMIEINERSMKLEVDGKNIDIPFENHIVDSEDAHKTLVSMIRALPSKSEI